MTRRDTSSGSNPCSPPTWRQTRSTAGVESINTIQIKQQRPALNIIISSIIDEIARWDGPRSKLVSGHRFSDDASSTISTPSGAEQIKNKRTFFSIPYTEYETSSPVVSTSVVPRVAATSDGVLPRRIAPVPYAPFPTRRKDAHFQQAVDLILGPGNSHGQRLRRDIDHARAK